MTDFRSRRQVLRSGVALGSLTVAGCLDGSGDTDESSNGTNGTPDNTTSPNSSDPDGTDEPEQTMIDRWPMYRYDAQNTGFVDVEPPRENVGKLWNLDIGTSINSNPVVDGKTVYLRDAEGTAYAIEEGEIQWSESLGGEQVEVSPAIFEDFLIVPHSEGLFALNRTDGSEEWSYSTPEVPTELTVTEELVIFADESDIIHCVKAGNNQEQWTKEPTVDRTGFVGAPAVLDGDAYIRQSPPVDAEFGQIVKIDLESGYIRSAVTENEYFGWAISVHESGIYTGGDGVFAFDLDGNKMWEHPTGNKVKSVPVITHNRVFGVEEHITEPKIHALDRESGDLHWTRGINMFTPPAPVVFGDLIVFGEGGEKRIAAYSVDEFDLEWEIDEDFDTFLDPSVSNGEIFFLSDKGSVFSIGEK